MAASSTYMDDVDSYDASEVERELKEKFLDEIASLDIDQLKKFSKWQYVKRLEGEMQSLMPLFPHDKIKTSCHYIGNALNNPVVSS